MKIDLKSVIKDSSKNWSLKNPIMSKGLIAYEEDTNKIKLFDGEHSFNDLPYVSDSVSVTTVDMSVLSSRMNVLEEQLSSLKKTDIVEVTGSITQKDKDVVLKVANIDKKVECVGKSVTIDGGAVANDARIVVSAQTDVEMKNTTFSGEFKKATSNAVIVANEAEYVSMKNVSSDETFKCYNGVEIGLSGMNLPKSVLIDSCKFDGKFDNNAISIHGTADNAVININNCSFETVSNALRLSNRTNAKNIVINISNCSCEQWAEGDYRGLIILQDFTSKSLEESMANNLFAPEKITINISNCTYKGKKLTTADLKDVIYLWRDKEGKAIRYSEQPSYFPTINII